ncbi:MAG TPA: hypothetical protein DIC56_02490 [Rhizobium sp.]|nr:hypothetical protein [Rhizobium sp.]
MTKPLDKQSCAELRKHIENAEQVISMLRELGGSDPAGRWAQAAELVNDDLHRLRQEVTGRC